MVKAMLQNSYLLLLKRYDFDNPGSPVNEMERGLIS